MLAILAPILVFGLVIFIHELGHFIAAKAVGVYAPRFSIGFGPALFKTKRGETEYILAALPIGGYVRMASRLDEETAFLEGGNETANAEKSEEKKDWDPEAMIPFGPNPCPEHRWFESKPLPARLLIIIAGVTMNIILAIVIISIMAMHAGRDVLPTTRIGAVKVVASLPALAELRTGDTITAVDGKNVATWNDVTQGILGGHGPLTIQTKRSTVTVETKSDSDRIAAYRAIGVFVTTYIDSIVPGDRAAKAGLQRGDSVTAIDGQPVRLWSDLTDKVGASIEKPLTFDVMRSGAPVHLTITPKAVVNANRRSASDS